MQRDQAGAGHWGEVWETLGLQPPIRPGDPALSRSVACFHHLFTELLKGLRGAGATLLEAGCGGSRWLPYFAREFGFAVAGIDYSPQGCQQSRELLAQEGVDGEVLCADLFQPHTEWQDRFDVAVSFGVVEHFSDTADAVAAIARFVKPGGIVLTTIPNMTGATGMAQRLLNPAVYRVHVPLDANALSGAHERAGLRVERGGYLMSTDFHVCSLLGLPPTAATHARKLAAKLLCRGSRIVWSLEDAFGALTPNRITSPFAYCLARRP